jgi:hypothetical protein
MCISERRLRGDGKEGETVWSCLFEVEISAIQEGEGEDILKKWSKNERTMENIDKILKNSCSSYQYLQRTVKTKSYFQKQCWSIRKTSEILQKQ